MDPSKSTILWWSKATGCFPKSVPVGAIFNIDQGEVTISSATNFSIPFVANDIKYNDPHILGDFNTLVKRYYPGVTSAPDIVSSSSIHPVLNPYNNFSGIPLVDVDSGVLKLKWKKSGLQKSRSHVSSLASKLNNVASAVTAAKAATASSAAKNVSIDPNSPTYRGPEAYKYGSY